MSFLINRPVWTRETLGGVGINWQNPISQGILFASTPSVGINLVDGGHATLSLSSFAQGILIGAVPGTAWFFEPTTFIDYPTIKYFQTVPSSGPGWTVLGLCRSTGAAGGGNTQFIANINYDGTTIPLSLEIDNSLTDRSGACYYNGAFRNSGITTNITGDKKWHVVVGVYRPGVALEYWVDGNLDATNSSVSNGSSHVNTNAFSVGIYKHDNKSFLGNIALVVAWNRDLPPSAITSISNTLTAPWQLFKPKIRRLWLPKVSVTNLTGGATTNLKNIIESSTGQIGVIAGVTETLGKITESATGVQTNTGSASSNLKAILETGGGFFGTAEIGGGSSNLNKITESATGVLTLIGSAADTLSKVTDSSVGKIGSIGSAQSLLNKITEQATGATQVTNIVGSALSNLLAIKATGIGINPNPLAQPVSQGGAPAWWGYEGFDGTRRPWWYKDMKDKARELERMRKLRIKLGILPPDETKVEDLIEEVREFADEIPTPASADYYIARQEALSARIEALVDNMQEEEDEQYVMSMSTFFFNRKEAVWQTH